MKSISGLVPLTKRRQQLRIHAQKYQTTMELHSEPNVTGNET